MANKIKARPEGKHTIRRGEMVRLIAEETGYHVYEAEDMYNGLIEVMWRELEAGNQIAFENLGRIHIEKPKPRWLYSPADNETYLSPARPRVRFEVSDWYKRKLADPYYKVDYFKDRSNDRKQNEE